MFDAGLKFGAEYAGFYGDLVVNFATSGIPGAEGIRKDAITTLLRYGGDKLSDAIFDAAKNDAYYSYFDTTDTIWIRNPSSS